MNGVSTGPGRAPGLLDLMSSYEAQLQGLVRNTAGGPSGWVPERLIFRDWWHWRERDLRFAHGRLALTGQNGGGKSTLLSLCVPTLLDGETAGSRLDPALSRDRHVSWYLLGDDGADPDQADAFAYEARTGYLALEFRHAGSGRFLTIGMGMSAARNHPRLIREWWGFVVPHRRLGHDWDVREAEGSNCVGARDLQRLLPPPAVVTVERSEYRRQVNAHLFAMEDDAYHALIAMLLQARRPRLGEQDGPDAVCTLLRSALPPVPAERLERVAEVVENIERYQRNLEVAAGRLEVVSAVDDRLRQLSAVLVQAAMRDYQETAGQLGNVAGRLQSARTNLESEESAFARLRESTTARARRRSEVQATLVAYRERPDVDLPSQLEAAEAGASDAERLVRDFQSVLRHAEERMAAHDRALAADAQRFRNRRDEMARRWRVLADRAEATSWAIGARALRLAADAAGQLDVASAGTALAETWPDAALAAEAAVIARAYRQLANCRTARDEAESEVQRRRARLDDLRAKQAAAADGEARADRRVGEAREVVESGLEAWRTGSSALALERAALAPVTELVAALEAVPEDGPARFLDPLRQAGAARRVALDAARARALQEAGRTAVLVESLAAETAELRGHGPLPERTALRRAARTAASGGTQPLFRLVRFREGLDPLMAAAIEAAGLEAGLFDLLIGGGDGDAWALAPDPDPAAAGGGAPNLLEVLEPEPGAPETVRAVLASVGWGEGAGRAWIAPDGRWQYGRGAGQVAPWLREAAGVVGADRRALAQGARLQTLDAASQTAEDRRQRAVRAAADAASTAEAIEHELAAAAALPWQPLFTALHERASATRAAEETRQQVELARPPYDAAVTAFDRAHQAYEAALGAVPAARGLDAQGLRDRAADVASLGEQLAALGPAELTDLMDGHRVRVGQRALDADQAGTVRPRLEAAGVALAGAQAEVAALRNRLSDPSVERLHRAIADLTAELAGIETAEHAEERQLVAVEERSKALRDSIREQEPVARALREQAGGRLTRLRERLTLHESSAGLAEALEREGPVAVLPRLPRPVAGGRDEIEDAVQAAKGDLLQCVRDHLDVLGDERPQPVGAWESLTFHRERQAITASELGRSLAAEVERGRHLIAEQERELYERIIYQGILDVLRHLIEQARRFTRRTNALLSRLRLSGGERLSLRLVPGEAGRVAGSALGRALEEMQQGTTWLSDERREILLGQIREEVQRVRQDAAAAGQALGYYDAIQLALDYRRWYEYQLWSVPAGGGPAVQVRSRGFGRRSTSAKAWALTVPILAGVAARYEAAGSPDAPKLVALDEVFAGFDPNNQANYLQFLGGMGLCWIITCPDELPYGPGLSAAMAYRLALDANVHTAFPILWDGSRAVDLLLGPAREAAAAADPGEGRGVAPDAGHP